jgi:hypothetical protein
MTDKRIIIHVGDGKTGSSAIQKHLLDNSKALETAGIHYGGLQLNLPPRGPDDFTGNPDLYRAIEQPGFATRLAAILRHRFAIRPGIHTVIWSNEALIGRAADIAQLLPLIAGEAELTVVLYLRHQADWLRSAYLQWGIKDKAYQGPIIGLDRFLERWLDRCDYRTIIEAWIDAVGRNRLVLRSYDATPDVTADFVTAAELALPPGALTPGERFYETPDRSVMSLFKVLNGQSDAPHPPEPLISVLRRNDILAKRFRKVDPAVEEFTPEHHAAIVARFEEINAELAAKHGIVLRPTAPPVPCAPDEAGLATTDLVAALLELVISLDRRVLALEKALERGSVR